MTVALNMKSASFQSKVADAILSGVNPADAVKTVRAQALAELAVKSAKIAARAATFEILKEEGVEKQAALELIDFVRLQYIGRKADKAASKPARLYKPYVAMILARRWHKAGWEFGHCYADQISLDALTKAIATEEEETEE